MPTRPEEPIDKKPTIPRKLPEAKPIETATVERVDGGASISYSISITKSLGAYESLRIEAGVRMPLLEPLQSNRKAALAQLDNLLIAARECVTARIEADITDIKSHLE